MALKPEDKERFYQIWLHERLSKDTNAAAAVAVKKTQDGAIALDFWPSDLKVAEFSAAKCMEQMDNTNLSQQERDEAAQQGTDCFDDFYKMNRLAMTSSTDGSSTFPSKQDGCIDWNMVEQFYTKLQSVGALDATTAKIASLVEKILPHVTDKGVLEVLDSPADIRWLAISLVHPLWSDPPQYERLSSFLSIFPKLSEDLRTCLTGWFTFVPKLNLIHSLQQYMTIVLLTLDPTEMPYEEFQKQAGPKIYNALSLLKILYDANELHRTDVLRKQRNRQMVDDEAIAHQEFINESLNNNDKLLRNDYLQWSGHGQNRGVCFGLLEFAFVLNAESKFHILQIESTMQQRHETRQHVLSQIFMGAGSILPYLVLKIRRNNIMQDALQQLAMVDTASLKKPLRIMFDGEEGIDEGGVKKELFQLLITELFNPEFAMFEYDAETRLFWFNKTSFETNLQFELFGIVLGLAIYNRVILDVHFPLVVYTKLLAADGQVDATLDELAEFSPSLAKGLTDLLNFDGDVESVFCRNFTVSYDSYGAVETVPLCEDGDNKPVTNENREEFVNLYVNWALNTSVSSQFGAFKRGFDKCVSPHTLKLFRPDDLELTICGSTELDLAAQKSNTEYQDGYTETSSVSVWFWEVVLGEMDAVAHRRLLSFCTGSDRAPPKGLGSPESRLVISRYGPDADRLPSAHTCFNHLLIPEYSSKDKLKRLLFQAIENCQGFGLM